MKKFKIVIEANALLDIQEATDWYNEQAPGLGARFQRQVNLQINSLKNTPYSYAVRYSNVRCTLVRKFPFMIHFIIDGLQKRVEVFAVIHTSSNPKIWEGRAGV